MDAIQEEYEENGSDSSGDSSDSELAESMLQIENLRKLVSFINRHCPQRIPFNAHLHLACKVPLPI